MLRVPGQAGVTELDVILPLRRHGSGMSWAEARLAAWRSVRPLPPVELPLA